MYTKDNISSLYERIPLKYFPKEYGGENGSVQQAVEDYHKVWDEYRDYFKQNAEFGTDESLRPGKPIDFDGLFGMCGSFRKIEVD